MSEHKNRNPIEWFLHICLMVLIGALALNWAIGILTVLIPWLIGGALIVVGVVYAVMKLRNRW